MPQFDPRREPVRLAPSLGAITLAICAAGMMTSAHGEPSKASHVRHAGVIPAAAQANAQAVAALPPAPPVYETPEILPVKLRGGETLEAAVVRAGVLPQEAAKAAEMIRANFDPSELEPGFRFQTSVSPLRGQEGAGRLVSLEMRPTPARLITVARTAQHDFRLSDEEEAIVQEAGVVEGEIRGSLYSSAKNAGVGGSTLKEIVKVFAAKLDFQRDIKAGNRFRLVFDQTRTESGKVIETGDLLYAEVQAKGKATRFYRFERSDGRVEWLDEGAQNLKTRLLRSPVDGARMSSGFGMRRHPILGYHKMHQGVDFAAGTGTPVMAAGDGTVVEIRRWGGYGNWLRIRHASGYESGYAHLSKYASGLRVGQKVNQGEVVAYVGSTGRSTGPHLHHEIWLKGARVDPKGAKVPSGGGLEGRELAAFKAQKKKVDAALKGFETQFAGQKPGGLRPAQKA